MIPEVIICWNQITLSQLSAIVFDGMDYVPFIKILLPNPNPDPNPDPNPNPMKT